VLTLIAVAPGAIVLVVDRIGASPSTLAKESTA
jgi:hypothetical protein